MTRVLSAISVALALLVAATPQALAACEGRAAADGTTEWEYCSPAMEFYGAGGEWTWVKMRACLVTNGDGKLWVRARVDDTQWARGVFKTWYRPSGTKEGIHTYRLTATVYLGKTRLGDFDTYPYGVDTTPTTVNSGGSTLYSVPAKGRGDYSVVFQFQQDGPYWTEKTYQINSGERSVALRMPCPHV
ncbi:hypothetical protein [Allokutzneria sp. NRRL B-24872]|uniref:hypothetical protein n=1 Tax=Allokutzneria sp. NRRL B-24872 TaxID=1137961 RepID=UPI000A36485C|nr:hypothetical protein [Allokutzneria sp. NRRL B-24872]